MPEPLDPPPDRPDDPRLTAYALGEFDPDEAARFEAELGARPESRALLLEIQGIARLLAEGLNAEAGPAPNPGLPSAIAARLRPPRSRLRRWAWPALAASALGLFATLSWTLLDRPKPVGDRPMLARAETKGAIPAPAVPAAAFRTSNAPATAPAPSAAEPEADRRLAAVADAPAEPAPGAGANLAVKSARMVLGPRRLGDRPWVSLGEPRVDKAKEVREDLARASLPAGFRSTGLTPTATFPAAPGSDSYARAAEDLDRGALPARDLIRTEDFINALPYRWIEARAGEPIGCAVEVARCPWDAGHRLVRLGLRAREDSSDVVVAIRFRPERASAYRIVGLDEHPNVGPADPVLPAKAASLRSGRAFTALCEIIPAAAGAGGPRLMDVEVRFKVGDPPMARSIVRSVDDSDRPFAEASADFRLASALAGFGMLLGDSPARGTLTWDSLLGLAEGAVGDDPTGERRRFVELCRAARRLAGR